MALSNQPKELAMKKSTLAVLLLAGFAAQSASAADWFFRGGLTSVNPNSDNGSLAGGALDTSIDSNTQIGLTVGYHLNPNVAIEVLAATPFTHDVSLNGAKAGSFKHLPPTVSLQYYFNAEGKVSPFVGAGVNYTLTFSEETKNGGPISGADLSVGNSFGFAGQVGLRFAASENWDVVVDARYIDINADVSVNGSNVGEAVVDPMVYSIMIGKRF
jgi:outer membrane protein